MRYIIPTNFYSQNSSLQNNNNAITSLGVKYNVRHSDLASHKRICTYTLRETLYLLGGKILCTWKDLVALAVRFTQKLVNRLVLWIFFASAV